MATNNEIKQEALVFWKQNTHIWKRAEGVAKYFDVSLGTVKNWQRQGLIKGYKHERTVIYDVNAIEHDLFKVEN